MSLRNRLLKDIANFRVHPLGFYYNASEVSAGTSERIHVWLSERRDSIANECHSHSYDISSSTLSGRMRSEIFDFTANEAGQQLEFSVSYEAGKSKLSRTGRTGSLVSRCTFDTVPNGSYFLPAGVIHRVKIIEFPCVTRLLTFERSIPIFSYGDDAEEHPFERRSIDETEKSQLGIALRLV